MQTLLLLTTDRRESNMHTPMIYERSGICSYTSVTRHGIPVPKKLWVTSQYI